MLRPTMPAAVIPIATVTVAAAKCTLKTTSRHSPLEEKEDQDNEDDEHE